jgi:hypothetical protein
MGRQVRQLRASSNVGYRLLGRVIENHGPTLRGLCAQCGTQALRYQRYDDCRLEQRRPAEVNYYGQADRDNPCGRNVTRMDSHGGGSRAELVQFLMHVIRSPTKSPRFGSSY